MNRTSWNPDWSAAIERVRTLVESIFSCRVKFQTVDTFLDRRTAEGAAPFDRKFLEQDLVFLQSTLFEPPKIIRGTQTGTFAFPLRIRRAGARVNDVSLVGIALVEGLAAHDDLRVDQLGEFLQMVTESRLEAFERLMDVEREERFFLAQTQIRESAKVVRLFPNSPTEPVVEGLPSDDELFQLDPSATEVNFIKPVVLLGSAASAKNGFPFARVALELFNHTSLWFFVNISDLSEEAFQSAQTFRDLGRMCVFIPDLADVSIEKQLRIAEVFSTLETTSANDDEGAVINIELPRLITVIHDTPASLISSGAVLPHLLALLTPVHIDPALLAASSTSAQTIRKVVKQIEKQLDVPRDETARTSNLIPLLGRWRQDGGSNPTFH